MTKSGKVSKLKSTSNDIWAIGQFAQADLLGPMRIESIGNIRQFSCLTDALSQVRHAKFLKGKTPVEVLVHLQELYALMNTETGFKIKGLWCDGGKNFENSSIMEWQSQRRMLRTRLSWSGSRNVE